MKNMMMKNSPLFNIYLNRLAYNIWIKYQSQSIYFLSVKKRDLGIAQLKELKGLILGVIEYGESLTEHFHLLSTTNEFGLLGASCKTISNSMDLYHRLKYMQKEKDSLYWDFNLFKKEELSCREKSELEYEKLLESQQKEQYKLEEIHELLNINKKNINKNTKTPSIIVKTQHTILKYVYKLSIKLELPFDTILNQSIRGKIRKNTTIEVLQINSFLTSEIVQLNIRSLLWYTLYLVIFLGGTSGIVMQELYRKIGMYMLLTFEQIQSIESDKLYYRLGNYLCNALEKVLKEENILLWSKTDDLNISILETVNKYVSDEIKIKQNFLSYLNIENIFESSIAMILKPLTTTGYLTLNNIKTKTKQAENINIKVSKQGYDVIEKLQQVRYKINHVMYNYLKSNYSYFLSLYDEEKKQLKVFSKPDFANYNTNAINKLESVLISSTNHEINLTYLTEHILDKVIVATAQIKNINTVHQLSSKLQLNIKKVLVYTNYTNAGLNKTKLYHVCKELFTDYKTLLLEYHQYKTYKNKLYGIKSKIRTLKDTFSILDIWAKDYIYYDNKESLYFVWRIDHRGRLYTIGNNNMMSNKCLRYCLEPVYSYSFKENYNNIIIDISHNYFGTNDIDINHISMFHSHIDKWLSNKYKYIKQADNPFGFLRGILEYELFKSIPNYKTSYLISLDGTANVYQHVSCLTKDRNLARAVNVIKTEQPNDLYSQLLSDIDTTELNLVLTRKTIKKSVMCYAYGLTDHGRLNYLKASLPDAPIDEVIKLSKLLHLQLAKTYPGVLKVRRLLENLVTEKCKQGLPITISNNYLEWKHLKYKTKKKVFSYTKPFNIYRTKTRIYMLENTQTLDHAKLKTSITANYIHHLDSESLMTTILDYSKITNNKPIFTIHDCFMVPAPYKQQLLSSFKKSLLDIYNNKNKIKELYLLNNVDYTDSCDEIDYDTFEIIDILESNHILC